jgi:lipopolysaccharide export system ATP-binding protein
VTGPALIARDVAVRIGASEVVRGVTFEVAPGEVLGVLGPSGAGKTTLFRALVGEIPPTRGTVSLGEADVTREPLHRRARRGLGYVPQSPSVLFDLTVADNFATFERLVGADAPLGPKRWAERVDLAHRLDVRAGDLSGGERRRLELGRALVARPRVLVCDEPFAGIDPSGALRIGDLLRDRAAEGVGIVLADHHVAEALRICDRAALLLDGRIEVVAPPDEFRQHPSVRGRYLGTLGA